MNQQLICETKIKLVNFAFQTPHNDNATTIIDSMMVVNDFQNINSGSIVLSKTDEFEYKPIGSTNTEYSFIQIIANIPIILNFAVETEEINLITSNFSYINPIKKIKNLTIANNTLATIARDTFVNFVIIESFDYKYTTFGDFYGL